MSSFPRVIEQPGDAAGPEQQHGDDEAELGHEHVLAADERGRGGVLGLVY